MEVALMLALVGLIVWLGAKRSFAEAERQQHNQRQWWAAAQALKLKASGGEDRRSMAGPIRGVPVHVDFVREHRSVGKSSGVVEETTFTAGGDGRIPRALSLKQEDPEGFFAGFVAGLDGPTAQTGDAEFDRQIELAKMNAHVCAALSELAREHIPTFVSLGGSVSKGVVTWQFGEIEHMDRQWLSERIADVVALAEALSVTPETLPSRLAHNAVHDSDPNVRLRNLRYLLAAETRAPAELVATTARALLDDRSRAIRFHAALQLGLEGHPTLRALAAAEQEAPALRAQALNALHEANAADLVELVASLLTPSPPELARAALAIVAARDLSVHVERVIDLTGASDAALRVAATRTLGSLDAPKILPRLLELLGDDEAEVQTAAAQALGTLGAVTAVEPLLALTKGFGRTSLRDAARGAIARIQARLGDVEGGRVSLAEDDDLAGAVALADAEAARGGEVTLAHEAEPRSLAPRRGD